MKRLMRQIGMSRPRRIVRFVAMFVFALVVVTGASLMIPTSTAHAQEGPVAPELTPNLGWLNTDRPLTFDGDLAGHVVLLDFWTYCCINCMHILPDLEYLEHKYADEPFVVVGVHSAKFTTEADREGIRNAMFRYDIRHPVVIDDRHAIWNRFGVRSWPTMVLIGADGRVIGAVSGEGNRDLLDEAIKQALADARDAETLAPQRVAIKADARPPSPTGLHYPGKVLAVAPTPATPGMLFIADSSSDRIILATWPDDQGRCDLVRLIGTGQRGLVDGPASSARFHDPQGMAYQPSSGTLFVADTKNHAIRSIDIDSGSVATLVGDGTQSYDRVGGNAGSDQGLSSPWALALTPDDDALVIAMAGPHQLWTVGLESRIARAIAGGRGENLLDGPGPTALLAQPSGLALSTDGRTVYFADSEVSAIRTLDLESGAVATLLGSGLFDYGDVDGFAADARLQHPLGVAVWPTDTGDKVLIADTYNAKIKILNPEHRMVRHWVGRPDGPGSSGDPRLAEPGGISVAIEHLDDTTTRATVFVADTNHHRVVMIDPTDRSWHEVMISGLSSGPADQALPADAIAATVGVGTGPAVPIELTLDLPDGAKPNAEYPAAVRVTRVVEGKPTEAVYQRTLPTAALPVTIEVQDIRAGDRVLVELSMAYCFDDAGLCLPADAAWLVDLVPGEPTPLRATIEPDGS